MDGKPLYIYERYKKGDLQVENALITNFISAIQSFASELGEQHANTIKLGDSMLFSTKDQISNVYFVIRTDFKAKPKQIFKLLNEIKNLFINKVLSRLNASDDEKKELLKEFEKDLEKIIKEDDNIESFLQGL